MPFLLVYVTHPNEASAREMADQIVRGRLAACANIFPMHSEYWWLGKVETSDEWVTLFKTTQDGMEPLEARIIKLHSYEVPCIVRWEVKANTSYEDWIRAEVL